MPNDMRDRLIELISDKENKLYSTNEYRIACLADHLIENGVILPPCKVGDTVYQTDTERVYASNVKAIVYDTDNIAFDERAIGKTVFLTREDAEKALREREGE